MTIRNVPPVPAFTEWVGADGRFSEAAHNYLVQVSRVLSELKAAVDAIDTATEEAATADPDPGRSPVLFRAELFSSGTWVAPWTCYARIWLVGGAGSGGARRVSGTARASGGGGGETSLKENFLIQNGKSLAVTVGAGGAAVVGGGGANGLPGGTSIIEGEGIYMTALGGAGGTNVTSGTAAAAAGGTGGIGGDYHFPGQASPARTSGDDGTCGGTFGLVSSPTTLANNTKTAQDALDQMTTQLDVWQWITRGAFLSGNGRNFGDGFVTVNGSPGCGGGGAGHDSGTGSATSGSGGDGFCIIEYSAPVET